MFRVHAKAKHAGLNGPIVAVTEIARASVSARLLASFSAIVSMARKTILTPITHGHFNPCKRMAERDRDSRVTEAVIEFLDALFDGRVLVYRSPDRRGGGWQLPNDKIDRSRPVPGTEHYECFVWSGSGANGSQIRSRLMCGASFVLATPRTFSDFSCTHDSIPVPDGPSLPN